MSQPAAAWDGAVSGKIVGLDVTGGGNYDFRVYLDSGATCGNGNNWAYVNKSYDNYDAMVSMMTLAFASNKNVIIYSTRDAAGFCQIGYLAIRP